MANPKLIEAIHPGKPRGAALNRHWSALLTACLIIVALACTDKQPSQERISREPVSLGMPLQPGSSLLIIANDKGFFSREGLDVHVLEYPSGKRAMIEGLLTGVVEVVTAADVPFVFNNFERKDFRIVAAISLADNVNRIVARRDGVKGPGDLRGKRVATQKASAVHFFLHSFMVKNGLADSDIEMDFMKAEELPKALTAGEIDAFSMREPYVSQAAALLGGNVVIFEEPGLYSMTDYLIVSDNLINNRPTVVKRLVRALVEAEGFARRHRKEAIGIISSRLGAPEPEVAAFLTDFKFEVSLRQSHVTSLEDIARWAISHGFTEKYAIPDYLDFINAAAMEEVRPETVTIIRPQ